MGFGYRAERNLKAPLSPVCLPHVPRQDLVELRERVRSNVEEIGLSFGPGRPMTVDPVPRVIDAAEWEALEAGLLQRARALVDSAARASEESRGFELFAEDLRLAQAALGEITGEVTSEDLLGAIFAGFCIGK